jgi:signal transduction histidine kinase
MSCEDLQKTLSAMPLSAEAASSLRLTIEDGIGGALRYIASSVSKLERLISALLRLSRTGQQTYRREQLNISRLVESAVEASQQAIKTAGANVTIRTLPTCVGDMTAIGQVFANLLDNAIKYLQADRPGTIEIGGITEASHVHYWVRDNGTGIPTNARARLFQIFQRFHPELAAGEGIGLAAVKRIVERHGGEIWVESEAGCGSTFHFRLPAISPDVEHDPDHEAGRPCQVGQGDKASEPVDCCGPLAQPEPRRLP